ncbi:MAG: Gfo/Idh/MocA family oxidoreductase [Kiritimatiellae bacterium]|nr:Gfo/Idh/MocA family oxidoreductase [Kiritimatiellia bacterium]
MMTTTRPPIRVGLVGLGRAGYGMHVPELSQCGELFKIVAVCDPLKERRDLILKQLPACRSYRRYEDILLDPDVELIDLATRSDEHGRQAVEALRAGKWVNVERPFSRDYEEARMVQAAAARIGNRLLVRHNYRYEAPFIKTREVIESGLLGEVYDIKIRRGTFIRRDDWQTVKRCAGGAALTWGPAFLDQALELLKGPPVKVFSDFKRVASVGDAEDYVRIVMRNGSGMTVDLEISGGRVGRDPLFQVSGTRGEFRIYDGEETAQIRYLDPKAALARRRSSVRTPPLGAFGTPESLAWIEKRIPARPEGEAGPHLIWEQVFNTIRENKPYPVPLESAIETLRILTLLKKESAFA